MAVKNRSGGKKAAAVADQRADDIVARYTGMHLEHVRCLLPGCGYEARGRNTAEARGMLSQHQREGCPAVSA